MNYELNRLHFFASYQVFSVFIYFFTHLPSGFWTHDFTLHLILQGRIGVYSWARAHWPELSNINHQYIINIYNLFISHFLWRSIYYINKNKWIENLWKQSKRDRLILDFRNTSLYFLHFRWWSHSLGSPWKMQKGSYIWKIIFFLNNSNLSPCGKDIPGLPELRDHQRKCKKYKRVFQKLWISLFLLLYFHRFSIHLILLI